MLFRSFARLCWQNPPNPAWGQETAFFHSLSFSLPAGFFFFFFLKATHFCMSRQCVEMWEDDMRCSNRGKREKWNVGNTVCTAARRHNKMNSPAAHSWCLREGLPPALLSDVAYLSQRTRHLVWVCWDTIDQLVIGGVVAWAGPAKRKVIWESVNAGHSPVMNKTALHPCCFKSVLSATKAAVVAVPNDKYHVNRRGAVCICRQNTQLPWHWSGIVLQNPLAIQSTDEFISVHVSVPGLCMSVCVSGRYFISLIFFVFGETSQVSVVLSAITAPNSSSRLCVECVHVCMHNTCITGSWAKSVSCIMRIIIWRILHKSIQNHLLMIYDKATLKRKN